MRRTDPLIVGGGPAGAAAAIALAQAGTRPLLLERQREAQPVVCGAFVGWDAVSALEALGLDPWGLGAHPIERVRVVAGGQVVERRLPHRAAGLSRQALDRALLGRAEAAGAAVERGVAVRAAEASRVRLADGATLAPGSLFLATGKHPLRGTPREGAQGRHLGLRATATPFPDLAGVIELHLFRGGYAGLLLQEDGCSNLCLSVAANRLAAARSPDRLLAELAAEAPRLADRLAGVTGAWVAIAGVPYGWRTAETGPGLFRLGDQAGVIPSLAGEGMGIAIASGIAAAAAYRDGGAAGAAAWQHGFARRLARPIGVAGLVRRVMESRFAPLATGLAGPDLIQIMAKLTRIAP